MGLYIGNSKKLKISTPLGSFKANIYFPFSSISLPSPTPTPTPIPPIVVEPIETWDISATETDNVIAELYENSENEGMYSLVISGSGRIRNDFMPTSSIPADGRIPIYVPWSRYDDKITVIKIGNEIEQIGQYAFDGFYNLKVINYTGTISQWNAIEFGYRWNRNTGNYTVHCTDIDIFKDGTILTGLSKTWDISATTDDNVIADLYYDSRLIGNLSLNISGDGNMMNYTRNNLPWASYLSIITDVKIENGIKSISDYAFEDCDYAVNATIPDSVTTIGKYAFAGCYDLINLTIPRGVISIGDAAFNNCQKLTHIILPDNISIIPKIMLGNCVNLVSIVISDKVTSIEYGAFYNCSKLVSITYNGTISQWEAIKFGSSWNYCTGNYTIHCTDGEIAKDGTVTYY